mmetsp:Transcript_18698/g.36007  ORF Transcript_18698/g.36007 Transcript_18698/m.36007 type:complete len:176 (+) Transcript_18698:1244-1771(+)
MTTISWCNSRCSSNVLMMMTRGRRREKLRRNLPPAPPHAMVGTAAPIPRMTEKADNNLARNVEKVDMTTRSGKTTTVVPTACTLAMGRLMVYTMDVVHHFEGKDHLRVIEEVHPAGRLLGGDPAAAAAGEMGRHRLGTDPQVLGAVARGLGGEVLALWDALARAGVLAGEVFLHG